MEKNKDVIFLRQFLRYTFTVIYSTDKTNRRAKLTYYAILFIVETTLISGALISLVNVTNPLLKIEIVFGILYQMCNISILIHYILDANQVNEFLSIFHENSSNYIGDEGMKMTSEKFKKDLWKNLLTIITILLTSCFTFLTGVFLETYVALELAHGETKYFSWFSCGLNESPKIGFCNDNGEIWKIAVFQISLIVAFSFTSIITFISCYYFILLTYSIEARLKIHSNILKDLTQGSNGINLNIYIKDKFPTIIKYQQDIYKKTQNIISTMNITLLLHNLMFFALAALCCLSISVRNYTDWTSNTKVILIGTYVGLIHYRCCKSSCIIGNVNETMLDTLLDFPWYQQTLEFRKCFFILLTITQKQHPLVIFGLFKMDSKLFSANMRRLYSFINMLLLRFQN